MTLTVVFDSACSSQEIEAALEQIRNVDGVDAREPVVPITFNHHEAGMVRVNLAPSADREHVMERLGALEHVTGVLPR